MAALVAKANGNLTDATATWGVGDATSLLFNAGAALASTATTTSFVASATFTPGAITIDGIAVRINNRVSATGTFSVDLFNSTGSVQVVGTQVDINTTDIPTSSSGLMEVGWMFFKFATPVLLIAATAYAVRVKSSSSGSVSVYRNGTAGNWLRILRTTTEAAPAAGDTLVIAKQFTAAATSTAITITMDSTAATDYGDNSTSTNDASLFIGDGCEFKSGITASTNYIFQLSGNCFVGRGGILSWGKSGAIVPATSTSIFQLDQGATDQFFWSLANGSTLNAWGAPRTAGKLITHTNLTVDLAGAGTSATVADDTGWKSGDVVVFAPTGTDATKRSQITLTADAISTGLAFSGGVTNAHKGTGPVLGHAILLTRNVQFKCVTTARFLGFRVYDCTISAQWANFRDLGATNTVGFASKAANNGGSLKQWQYCAFEAASQVFSLSSSFANDNWEIYDSVFHAAATANGLLVNNDNATATDSITNWKFSRNVLIGIGSGNDLVRLSICPNEFDDNVMAGGLEGLTVRFTNGPATPRTANRNQCYVNANEGLSFFGAGQHFFWDSCKFMRNAVDSAAHNVSFGFSATPTSAIRFTNCDFGGGAAANIGFTVASHFRLYLQDCNLECESGLGTYNFYCVAGSNIEVEAIHCNMDGSSGITGRQAPSTNHIGWDAADARRIVRFRFENCKTGSLALAHANVITAMEITPNHRDSWIRSTNDNSTPKHRTIGKYGTEQRNASTFNTAAPSSEMIPTSASAKLESKVVPIAVLSGQTPTVTAYVQKDGSYNGNAPRLMLKKNDALGVSADTALDTLTVGASTWEQLVGALPTAPADGVYEVFVDVDGTAGSAFHDDWAVAA